MTFVDADNLRIHYAMSGKPDGPVLVLSNSLGTRYAMWDSQAAEFEKHFRLLRYDTRGHGESSVPPGPYRITQLARDVLYLLDHLNLSQVHFCGLSMGGMIGMWLATNAPQRLRKLVLCNTAARIGTAETWNTRIDTVQQKGMQAVAAGVMERWFTPSFRTKNPEKVAAAQQMLEQTPPDGYVACCAAVRDFDGYDSIATIHVPTLVISGHHDPVTPPADGQFLAKSIAGARYAELDAAHLSNVEAQGPFTAEVCSFLLN